jgi:hypothetical protein
MQIYKTGISAILLNSKSGYDILQNKASLFGDALWVYF